MAAQKTVAETVDTGARLARPAREGPVRGLKHSVGEMGRAGVSANRSISR
jgi:hypothetical protein